MIEFGHSLVSTRVRLSVYNTVHSHVCLNLQNKRLLDKFNTKTDICWQVQCASSPDMSFPLCMFICLSVCHIFVSACCGENRSRYFNEILHKCTCKVLYDSMQNIWTITLVCRLFELLPLNVENIWNVEKNHLVRGDRDSRANLMPIYGDLYQIKL